MKPQVINCGSGCEWCDGYGIMTLQPDELIAPCLSCSPTRNLFDLMSEKRQAIIAFERAKELREIDQHNIRMKKETK